MKVSSCTLTSANTIQLKGTTGDVVGDDNKIYLFAVNPTNYRDIGSPLASTGDGSSFTVSGSVNNIQNYINDEFFTGIKVDGKYHLTSNGMYITNPEKAAKKTFARTNPINKKGLAIDWSQSLVSEAINTLHVKHVAINIPLIQVVSVNSGSQPNFTYAGTQYRFNGVIASSFKDRVRELNKAGVQVTCIVYADAGMCSSFPEYVTPTGRGGQAAGAALVGMNAQEEAGRKKLEAAFAFLASTFSDSDAHVDNWVIGNELDNPVTWNYCGESLALDYYATLYSQVYRLAYNAMKSVWSNVRVYDSLDNVWTVTSRGSRYYTAKGFQDEFAKVIKGEGDIKWGLAFHPYCAPELDPRIWLYPQFATNDGATTPRITLYNIQVLPVYVNSKYGSGHPIILSETGINAVYNGKGYAYSQAAAMAYGYYKVEMTSGLDNLIIHTYKDTAGEMAGGWYLGICKQDGTKRAAYHVFANMDGKTNGPKYTTVNKYGGKTLVQIIDSSKTKWSQLIPGFSMSGFQDKRY